jgi:peroxiredoxin
MPSTSSCRPAWYKPAAIAAVVVLLGVAVLGSMRSTTAAPNVTFIDLNGQKISSQSLHGKVVMVSFWATSCATCVKEMPQMVETYNKFKAQGLEFVAVAMQGDPPNYVLNYTETRKLPFTVALDSGGDLAKAFGNVAMTPTTFVIDKDGNIIKRYVGEPEFPALQQLLQKAISG